MKYSAAAKKCTILVAMALLPLLIAGTLPGLIHAATPSLFAVVPGPIGVAAAPSQLLVTGQCTGDVVQIDGFGSVTAFATIPGGGGCVERYIAISPGLGGFPANHIYVTQGSQIWKITPNGSSVTLFATIPSLPGSHNGITFDKVGTFGNDMIVTGRNGQIWRVNFSGVATLVLSFSSCGIEGPDVAPLSFGPVGGDVLVASGCASSVLAVSPAGVLTFVAAWSGAEGVQFVPPLVCSFDSSGGAFFVADPFSPPAHITEFPSSDFAGLGGSALVTSENGSGVGRISWNGTSFVVTPFQTNVGQHEGSAMVDCAVPGGCVRTQGFWKNHPGAWPVASLTLGTVSYSKTQLLNILQQPVNGNGLVSLAHQLIAARLNAASGASAPPSVQAAVASADALINGLVVPPTGGGSLAPSTTSALTEILDTYNQGLLVGGPPPCD